MQCSRAQGAGVGEDDGELAGKPHLEGKEEDERGSEVAVKPCKWSETINMPIASFKANSAQDLLDHILYQVRPRAPGSGGGGDACCRR